MGLKYNGYNNFLGAGTIRHNSSQGRSSLFLGGGRKRNIYGTFDDTCSVPNGLNQNGAWVLAPMAGGVASHNSIVGSSQMDALGALGRNLNAALSGAGEIFGAGALIISAIAFLLGSSQLDANVKGKLEATANLAGSGELVAALRAVAEVVANITGASEFNSTASAKAFASATISSQSTVLTTSSIADAVWNSLANAINNDGTTGEMLNRIKDILEADELLEPSKATRFKRGTNQVLLEKMVTGGNLTDTVEIKD